MAEPTTTTPFRPRWWARASFIVPAIVFFVLAGGLALLLVPRWLVAEWYPTGATSAQIDRAIGQAAQIVLFALGGVIALIGVGVSLSRHGQELETADRDRARSGLERDRHALDRDKEVQRMAEAQDQRTADQERALRARFVTAVELLADQQQPIRRVAGIYAIVALANDWGAMSRLDERQVCIDVLCGYLRAPLPPGVLATPDDEIEVRRTGYKLIESHLQESGGSRPRWEGAAISLDRALIDFDLRLVGLQMKGNTSLMLSNVTIRNCRVSLGAVDLEAASVQLFGADIANAEVDVTGVTATAGGSVNFGGAVIGSGGKVVVNGCDIHQSGSVNFDGAVIRDGGLVQIHGSKLMGARLVFARAKIIGGHVAVSTTSLTEHSVVDLIHATLDSGAKVDLGGCEAANDTVLWEDGLRVLADSVLIRPRQT
jgi:hypothetical protein